MSVQALSWAWQQRLGDPIGKLVLISLSDRADEYGFASVSQARLAEDACTTRSTANRKLREMVEEGLLEAYEPADGRDSVLYWFTALDPDETAAGVIQGLLVHEDERVRFDAAERVRRHPGLGSVSNRHTSCVEQESLTFGHGLDLPSQAKAKDARTVARRRRDPVWEAVTDVTKASSAERGVVAVAVRDIKATLGGEMDPEKLALEIRRRAENAPKRWGRLTPTALAKHWRRLDEPDEETARERRVLHALGMDKA